MLKKLFFIVSAFILSIPALADGTLVNGIYYKFSGTEATVTSNPNKYSGSVTIPEKVTYNNKEYSVTAIDFQAFANCSSLTSITIPNSVTSIGNYAFNGSSNLTSITIPNSITSIGPGAFENTGWYNNQPDGVVYIGKVLYKYKGTMPNNTEITIEEGTLNIAYEAFYGCSGLTSINIPNSVTRIEARVFMDCTGLTSITIPNGVTSIGSSTFSGCSGLTSITIPNTITTTGSKTFERCTGLTSITIPEGVTAIGSSTFSGCSGLTSITIPNSVTTIVSGAFSGCSGLTSIVIPNSVTTIDEYAFSGCSGLTSIVIPNGVPYISEATFRNCSNLSSITIPEGITSIGEEAFYGCSSLNSITIPNSVERIGDKAFEGCSGLTSITIPNTVKSICIASFKNCSSLLSVTIPSNISLIYRDAFSGCSELQNIYSYALTPIEIPENVFPTNNGSTILHVPAGTKSAYLNTAGWSKFGESNIVEFTINGSGQVDGIYYQFSESEASVKSNPQKYTGSVTIPSSVKHQGKTYNVTSISDNAFESCSGLTSVVIPNSVTSIGKEAFEGCSSLAEINIPDGVTSIAHQTFKNCNSLTAIVIPENVTGIAYEAFKGCSELTAITIPNSVRGIGKEAFEGCSSLAEINIPTGITSIGDQTFHDCSSLTAITIPDGVTSIGEEAFKGCLSITSITIPKSVATIKTSAFNQCPGLISLNVESDNAKYDSRGNCNAIINTETNSLLFGTKNTIIPNDVTSIASFAFYGCTTLTSITIPSNITSIGNNAFQNCTGLVSITIPSSVTSISANEFYGCSGLTSVTIPSSVTSIGSNAFEDCSALKSVVVNVASPLTIGSSVFTHRANATLYVPAGAKAAYEAADYWKDFKEIKETGTPSPNTINVETAGTLSSLISDENKFTITDLTITGQLNGTDFRLLREMAGNDYTGHPTEGKLEKLDLSGATIVEGGSYAEFEDNMCDLGDGRTAGAYISDFNNNSLPSCLFLGCSKLQEIKLPSSIVAIETGAFRHTGLTSFIVPKSTETLGIALFTGCDNLISLDVESGNTTYWAKDNAIIEYSTNRLVVACKNTTIPSEVLIIGQNAFYNSGETIVLPQNLVKIERDAFSGTSLKSISIPASVSEIEGGAFASCDNLIGITVDGGNTKYKSPEGSNAIIEKTTKTLVAGCQSTIIPSDVTAIGAGAFLNNINKNSISITLPASITSIGREAFSSCAGLSINLPTSITSIDELAFSYNSNLTVTVESKTPLNINENVFQGLSNSTLRVPAGSKSAYAAATGWKNFGMILEGNEGSTFTAKTTEGIDMVFTILDESAKTCQVGYLDGSFDKTAVDKNTVNGAVTIPNTANGYTVVKIGRYALPGVNGMKTVTIPNTVTSIDESAFQGCGLTSFVLPKNVTYLGRHALSALANVTSVKVEEGNTKYDSRDNCNAIIETATNILQFGYKISTIPASVKELGVDAFFNLFDCTLTIPSTITKINELAFAYNSNLTVTVESTTPLSINENVFQGLSNSTLRVPAGSKSAYAAATGWKNFGTILEGNEGSTFTAQTTEGIDIVFTILDESAKTCQVGYLDGSFDKTAVDKNTVNGAVTIPNTANGYKVVKIGRYALQSVNMTSVTIPNTVTTIDDYAFSSCVRLTSFELPASVTTLGTGALSAFWNVTSLTVAEGNTTFDSRDNCNAIIEKATNKIVAGCQTTTIPASATKIGTLAFDLSRGSIFIPSTVTTIEERAFICKNVTIQVERTTPLVINTYAFFDDITNSTLRVPAGCKSVYAEAIGWSKFGADNIIEENKVTLEDVKAGHLADKISDEFNITDLTITGQLNGTDFRLLRAMAGNDYTGHPTKGNLQKLDLSRVTIVEGGNTYYESDGIYRADNSKAAGRGGSQSLSTANNVVGPFLFAGCAQLSEVKIPTSTKEIGDWAFMMTNISALDIPDGVVKMWPSFSDETRVSTITIPKTVTNIVGSWGQINPYLSSIIVDPDNSKYDSRNNCNAIMEISTNTLVLGCKNTIIPDNTEIIGSYAFSGDTGESITLPQGLQTIGQDAFTGSSINNIAIPASVSQIEHDAFKNCNNLATITVDALNETYESPEGSNAIIKKSSKTLMVGCKSTIIPSDVTSIGVSAFYNNNGLTSITLPASIESIGDYAFGYCNNLTSVTVEAVEPLAINETVFSGTNTNATLYVPVGSKTAYQAADYWKEFKEIVEVEAPSGNIVFASNAVKEACVAKWDTNGDDELSYAEAAAVTSFENFSAGDSEFSFDEFQYFTGVTSLSNNSFSNRENLTSIILPSSITSIGSEAFWGSKITSINLGDLSNLTTIGTQAFSDCYRLTEVTLPANITTMGSSIFANCYNIVKVVSNIAVPLPNSGENSIIDIGNDAVLYVPEGTADAYKAAGWKESYGEIQSFRVITEGDYTPPVAREGLVYGGSDIWMGGNTQGQRLIYPGTYREGMMEYSLDGSNYSPHVPTGKDAGEYTIYYRKVGESVASTLQVTIALSGNIVFASDKVKAACVAKWDTNGDGELSYDEAAAVTSLVDPKDFEDPFALLTDVESDFTFDEFQYFTGVTSLTNYDFDEFEHLTSIVLPNSIQSIEGGAFYDCKLTSIHIPASVTDISDTYINESVIEVLYTPAFSSSFLQTITVDPENAKYSSPTGSNVIIDKTSNTLIMGCRNTDFSKIPNTVTTIAMRAFEGVEFANPAVNLPTSVEAIKAYAFNYSNIISINLGELTRLTEIGLTAFKDCDGLTEVTLPASITTMERAIFAGCDNIVKVVSNREEPLANNNNNFDPDHIIAIYNNAVLYVPSGKVEAYTNAGWEEPFEDDLKSFRVITDGDHTDPEAIEGLAYNGSDQKLILPGTYRTGMMEYSLDGSTYSTSIPTGKDAGSYTVYYRKIGESNASTLTATIAHTISVFSGTNLWAGYVAAENLALPTGLEAYVITNLGATTATASSLNYIPQGVPVLLKRKNASVNDYEISTGTGTAPTVNLLKTYDSDKSVSNREGFILYNDEFVLVNEGTLPAGRVFLPANGSGRALTRTIVFDRDDIVDFGDSQENNDDSNQWYDIQGRKLERKPTKKGIYILDGRKVVIK